jgi:hypothetical protein
MEKLIGCEAWGAACGDRRLRLWGHCGCMQHEVISCALIAAEDHGLRGGIGVLNAFPCVPPQVERVGWYQTRLRGKDTRPTYVPNSVFVETMVTNMDRITHRRFEANFGIRYLVRS